MARTKLSSSCGCPCPPSLVALTRTQYMAMDFMPFTVYVVIVIAFVLHLSHSVFSAGLISTKYALASSSTPSISLGLVQDRHRVV